MSFANHHRFGGRKFMCEDGSNQLYQGLRGEVEPHASKLDIPPDGQLLYKVMAVKHLHQSIAHNYLHFNRVDSYGDNPEADVNDGRQLPLDRLRNAEIGFTYDPGHTVADFHDSFRERAYACCFSLRNSDYIWRHYANGVAGGKVCVVFEFCRLRSTLNQTLRSGSAICDKDGNRCPPVLDLDYGVVEYVDWNKSSAHGEHLANSISYIYLKDRVFSSEEEFRITLSTLLPCQLPCSLRLRFDYRTAASSGTIVEVQCESDAQISYLAKRLPNLRLALRGKGLGYLGP